MRVLLYPCKGVKITLPLSRVGNFIIGASGSDKQMLCASSGARAALNIAAEKVNKRDRSVTRRKNLYCGVVFLKKENYMLLSSLFTVFSRNR